jgi:dihydroorotase
MQTEVYAIVLATGDDSLAILELRTVSESTNWLIEHGRLIDPETRTDRVGRLLLHGGVIAAIDPSDGDVPADVQRVDARGCIVAPGLFDLATEFGEPGREEDETIATGTAAAIAGGYTSVALSPHTEPPMDTAASIEFVYSKGLRADHCRLLPIGCVSKERKGETLAEIGSLVEAGAVALSDAPSALENTGLLRRALEYCSMFDRYVFDHPEIGSLARGGVMHEGLEQLKLGLSPIPAEAEDLATSRDLRLVEATGGKLHLTSISTLGSVELCRRAKQRSLPFSAGIYVANLHLSDDRMRSFDTNYKVKPPLRSREHVEACLAGLADGTIDIISSGHRPCSLEKKMLEIDAAPFGMMALETALAQVVTYLIRPGILDWLSVIEKMSLNPAKLLKQPGGRLSVGRPADVILVDPERRWLVDTDRMKSKSYNTPLDGSELVGWVRSTWVGGRRRYQAIETENGVRSAG